VDLVAAFLVAAVFLAAVFRVAVFFAAGAAVSVSFDAAASDVAAVVCDDAAAVPRVAEALFLAAVLLRATVFLAAAARFTAGFLAAPLVLAPPVPA